MGLPAVDERPVIATTKVFELSAVLGSLRGTVPAYWTKV
jgi:hypothetical protein